MGKSLQEHIKDLDIYMPHIEYVAGKFILKLTFKEGWSVINNYQDVVASAPDENIKGLYWFVSEIDDIDTLFDIIEETISVNKEVEKKLLFYNEKVKELEELIMSDISYDKLLTLQFTFTKPKKTTKAKKVVEEVADQKEPDVKNTETETNELNDIDKKVAEVLG